MTRSESRLAINLLRALLLSSLFSCDSFPTRQEELGEVRLDDMRSRNESPSGDKQPDPTGGDFDYSIQPEDSVRVDNIVSIEDAAAAVDAFRVIIALKAEDAVEEEAEAGDPGVITDEASKVDDVAPPGGLATAPTVVTSTYYKTSFSNRLFRQSMAYFTRVEPAFATSLRIKRLQDDSRSGEDFRYTVDPSIRLYKENQRSSFDGLYRLKLGLRWGDESQGVSEHRLNAAYVWKIQSRSEFDVRGHYRRSRGLEEEILEGDFSFLDQNLLELEAVFRRGRDRDRVRFDGKIAAGKVDYHSNEFEQFSHDRSTVAGNVFYQFRPRISYWFGMDLTDYDYDDSDLSSWELSTVIGGEFSFSSRLNARLGLGIQNKQFDAIDADIFLWNVFVNWLPYVNTHIRFRTSQRFVESYTRVLSKVREDTVDRRYGLGWSQVWSKRFTTEIGWSQTETLFSGPDYKRNDLFAILKYRARQKVTFRLYTSRYDRYFDGDKIRNSSLVKFEARYRF